MAEAPEGPRWGEIAAAVAKDFGLVNNRSPALTDAIERGVRFIVVDPSARELVFDMRALFLGVLAAGQQDRQSINFGNTATWFADWLGAKVGADKVAAALSPQNMADPDEVFRAFGGGIGVTISRSVRALLQRAQAIAVETNRPSEFEARHLFAAMILGGYIESETQRSLGVKLTAADLDEIKTDLATRIMTRPAPGEGGWGAVLGVSEPTASADRPAPPPDGVSGFARDSVAGAGTDFLQTGRDAEALARLVCLEQAAPLAIAIFGDWGSGKSTFMSRLDDAIKAIVEDQGGDVPEAAPGAPSAQFVERVVQIRFNAWQFVDANLWASLTSEFFDQLRAGGWERAGGARHAGLVERVNRHVHSLNSEVEAKREAAAAIGKDVLEAQKGAEAAAKAARDAPGLTLGRAAIDLLGEAYESQKGNLSALGLTVAGVDTDKAVGAIVTAAKAGDSILRQTLAVAKVIAKSPLRLAVVAASFVAFVWAAVWIWRQGFNAADVTAALVALGALGTAATALMPALKVVGAIAKRSADIAAQVDKADRATLKDLLAAEAKLRETTAEAEALEAAAQRSTQQLSRYVSPDGTANPPRLLRYVLEDDPDTKALQAEIGLIGRTRRLFQAVDDIAREERKLPRGKRPTDRAPDRIVLYIDDLDRCTDEQIYNVLQAIHLLLAFELFVVVVGVDVKRVRGALARALKPRAAVDEDDDAVAQLAASYLEKIFQIAFWLAPLSRDGDDGGSYARYVRGLAAPAPASVPVPTETSPAPVRTEEQAPAATDTPEATPAPAGTAEAAPIQPIDAVKVRRALATIELTDDEVAFLASPASAPVPTETSPAPVRTEEQAPAATGPPEATPAPAGTVEAAPIQPIDKVKVRRALATIELTDDEVAFLASPAIGAVAAPTPRAVKRLINVYRLARTRLSADGVSILGVAGQAPAYPLIALLVAIETGQPVEIADDFHEAICGLDGGTPLEALSLRSMAKENDAETALAGLYATSPILLTAIRAAAKIRGGDLTAAQALAVARVVRRYSFNSSAR